MCSPVVAVERAAFPAGSCSGRAVLFFVRLVGGENGERIKRIVKFVPPKVEFWREKCKKWKTANGESSLIS